MSTERPYQVPRQVTTRVEIFPGFGIPELIAVAAGGLVGYALYMLLGLFGLPVQIQIVAATLPPGLAFLAVKGGENSLVSHLLRAHIWIARPKRLHHRVGTGRDQLQPQTDRKSSSLAELLTDPLSTWIRGGKQPGPLQHLPQTVQEWLPVRDVSAGQVLRRDGTGIAAIEISPVNLALKSTGEQRTILASVHEAVNSLQLPAQILALPRPLDLDDYVRSLEQRLREVDPPRQRLLRAYIRYVSSLVTSGDAQERRYYILLAHPPGPGAREDLYQAAQDLAARLRQADLEAQVLDDRELLELLHVFSHPAQAAFERPPLGPPGITTLTRTEV